MAPEKKIQQLIDDFSRSNGITMSLMNGVCALMDQQGREALVIELPQGSDEMLLHCQLFPVQRYQDNVNAWRLMMMLNFEISAMLGCWLALDEDEQIRLCNQQPLKTLDSASFNTVLLAFMHQVNEVRILLLEEFTRL